MVQSKETITNDVTTKASKLLHRFKQYLALLDLPDNRVIFHLTIEKIWIYQTENHYTHIYVTRAAWYLSIHKGFKLFNKTEKRGHALYAWKPMKIWDSCVDAQHTFI